MVTLNEDCKFNHSHSLSSCCLVYYRSVVGYQKAAQSYFQVESCNMVITVYFYIAFHLKILQAFCKLHHLRCFMSLIQILVILNRLLCDLGWGGKKHYCVSSMLTDTSVEVNIFAFLFHFLLRMINI